MDLTPETVEREHRWVRGRADVIVPLINDLREEFTEIFETPVDPISEAAFLAEVDAVFADGDLAVNVAALVGMLRELDVQGDYPGFVVDEVLGRELAGAIAGSRPLGMLGEAAFHYLDTTHHADGGAGLDDLDAALAAGFQTRMPGWNWTERPSPFSVDPDR